MKKKLSTSDTQHIDIQSLKLIHDLEVHQIELELQNEEVLRRSKGLYGKMVANIGDVIVIIDENGINRYKSPNIEKLYGWKPEERIGTSAWENVHPEDMESIQKFFGTLINQVVATGTAEFRYRCKDNSYKWIEITAVNLLQDPDIKGILGNYHDISQRRLAEEKLRHVGRLYAFQSHINQAIVKTRERNELFRTICEVAIKFGQFRMAWIGLADETKNAIIPVAHAGIEDGYLDNLHISTGKEPIAKGPSGKAYNSGIIVTCNDIATDPMMLPWKEEALKRGYRSSVAVPFKCKGKTLGTLNLYASEPEFFNVDELILLEKIGENISFGLDAMDSEAVRKQSEERLKKVTAAVENTQASVIITDSNGIIEYVNPYFTRLTGYTPEEYIGKNPSVLKSGYHSIAFYDDLWQTIKSGKTWEGEFYNLKKNGEFFWENAIISPIRNDNNEITHFVAIKTDITEAKQIFEELILAKEHAEESDHLKSAFLANMSHEIRTPMNGILGFSDLLKEPTLTGDEQLKYIGIIEKSCVRMLNIINDIVDVSKIESGLIELHIKETDIKEQIEYIYSLFKPEVEKKGMQLYFKNSLTYEECILKTDSDKIFAILTNLIKNAIKYSDKGIIEFGCDRVETHGIVETHGRASLQNPAVLQNPAFLQNRAFIQFYVKDAGIGIPKDRQIAIFERFIQADIGDKRAFQGAGLGLSISKAYVEMLGGKIWVESEEGKGSVFYFTIPYYVEPNEKKMSENLIPKDMESENIKPLVSGLKILIAEDDEASAWLLAKAVKIFSEDVLRAKTGIEAIEACRNNPDIDLILMDVKMPEMDGYEATKLIRVFNKDVIIIAQTAYALTGERETATETGCDDYISKPFSHATLVALINKHLKNLKKNKLR